MEFEQLLWLMRSGAFLLAAIYFIKTGYWPRRTGTDPHCRRCEFNLAQAIAARCPECGASFTPSSVRVGQRDRVAWRTGVGLVCMAIALASVGIGARSLVNRGKLQRILPVSSLVWNLSDPA